MTSPENPSVSERNLIPDEVVRKLTSSRLIEAEIRSLTLRLDAIPEFKRDPGVSINAYVDALVKRRNDLLKEPRLATGAKSDIRANPLEFVVASIPFLSPWITANLPYMSEGINEAPGTPGTTGGIVTTGLFPGGLGYSANADDGEQGPATEKSWIHNWTGSFVFPSAPHSGKLFYRFTVESSCLVYRAPAYSGQILEFVTVGKTSDVLAQSPFDVDAWETVGWPVMVTLPHPDLIFFDGATVPVSGSIAVEEGKTPALGFIYGTIVMIASGYVDISWANFGTRLTLPPGTQYDGEVFDKIEYRFEPNWWLDAVNRRVNPVPQPG